jgi:hypothetical protein
VFVCEGEKDADRLAALGLTATTNPMGAGKWREEYAEPLRGRRVGLLPDHDEPGRKHAEQVAASLTRHGAVEVKVLPLPGLPDKGDVSDWLAAGHTAAELLSLAASAERWEPPEKPSRPAITGPITPPESEGPKPVRKGLEEVLATFRKWLYLPDAGALEVLLGAVAANYGRGDPVWLLLVGPPGGGKTEVLNSLSGLADVHPVAVLTEASLLSGTPQRDREKGTQGGLLYEVGRLGILLVKDFGGVLSLQKDTRGPVLAALREIYDGSWTRYVGTGGGKALSWSGKCGLVGRATPSIDQHYAVMSSLGERFAFYRLPPAQEPERAQRALQLAGQEDRMRPELAAAVTGLWAGLSPPRGIPALSPEEEARLVALAVFTTRCRSPVERDPYGNREVVLIPGAESPTRLVKMLALLLGGLDSLGCSRKRAWELIHKVAWDSMPCLRRQVVDTLRKAAPLTTTQVAATLGYPTNTTRRTLEDLACYEVVIRQSGGPGKADLWHLSDWTQATLNAARLPEGEEEDLGAYCSDGLEK